LSSVHEDRRRVHSDGLRTQAPTSGTELPVAERHQRRQRVRLGRRAERSPAHRSFRGNPRRQSTCADAAGPFGQPQLRRLR
jgi:hypothetical protein